MPENILHINAVRVRVNGTGILRLRLVGYDENIGQELVPLPMDQAPGKSLLRLANFIDQKSQLEVRTTDINEKFRINRIIVYAKPLWAEFPG